MDTSQQPDHPTPTDEGTIVETPAADESEVPHYKDESYDTAPRGIMAFLALMLVFYIVYWVLVWSEIFIGRGA